MGEHVLLRQIHATLIEADQRWPGTVCHVSDIPRPDKCWFNVHLVSSDHRRKGVTHSSDKTWHFGICWCIVNWALCRPNSYCFFVQLFLSVVLKKFGYDCNLSSLKRERTLRKHALGTLCVISLEAHGVINPRCNWDVRAGDVMNQEAIKPAQTKLSLA